jgi:pimeloyl-ACP methyl ester carboxylesterase
LEGKVQQDAASHGTDAAPEPARIKQRVITVHGVNPNRRWQPTVHRVLSAHFDPIGYDYSDYDTRLGPVRAIIHIPTFVTGVVLGITAGLACPEPFTFAGIGLGVTVALASFVLAWRARSRCAQRLKLFIDEQMPFGRPHLIAHSLGTYLIGKLLKKFPDLRLENVILVSTVLPRSYPWRDVLKDMPPKVFRVRSEFGEADFVVRAAGWTSWLARDLGNAGLYGFHDVENWVHTSRSPMQRCLDCAGRYLPAPVHNVPLKEFLHSDEFLSRKHALTLWLPYLWNIEPNELSEFLDSCINIARLETEERYSEANEIINRVWSRSYSWTQDRSLQDFVAESLAAWIMREPKIRAVKPDDALRQIRARLHTVVELAVAECSKPDCIDDWKARALHPAIAIPRAIRTLVFDGVR